MQILNILETSKVKFFYLHLINRIFPSNISIFIMKKLKINVIYFCNPIILSSIIVKFCGYLFFKRSMLFINIMDMLCKEIHAHRYWARKYFHDRGRETLKVLLLYSCTASIRSMIGCLWKANVVWAATKIAHFSGNYLGIFIKRL